MTYDNGMHEAHRVVDEFAAGLREVIGTARTAPLSSWESGELDRVDRETYELQSAVRSWPPNTDNRERLQSWIEGLRLAVEAIMAKYRPLPAPTFNEHDPVAQRAFIDNTAESLYRILGQMVQFPVITDKGRADLDRIRAQLAEKRAQKRPQLHEAPVRLDYSRDVIAAAQAATGVVREQVGTTELCTQMGPEWVQRYSRHQDLFISMVTAMIILVPGL
ncbi:hypothetical protein [Mycobacteroides abscessus]|uniref:hypothetical protein n=1 Tax=Mycobacteroides abscessus TaxID=36809 RepID=UPI00092A2C13|nr:hypothetical protein [Mycobacteroides abscessus]SIC21507.1 Uncharacterised protein [Mycobacteroides abscessus subsp. abscessus]